MKTNQRILCGGLLALMLITTAVSCKDSSGKSTGHAEASHEAPAQDAEHDHDEATLTAEQMQAAGVTIGRIEQKELTAVLKANGRLKVPNTNKANAATLYSGVVKTLSVRVGDYVRRGQVVATVANPEFVTRQRELLSLRSKMALAEQELKRQQMLYEGNAGTGRNLQQATAEVNALHTEFSALTKQIRLMGINPATLTNANMRTTLAVTAPISGIVSRVYATIGSYVDSSTPVVDVVDNSSLHLDLHVFERDLPKIRVGQTVHFTLTNNPTEEYDATIYSIGSSFEDESKTVAVHCRVKGNKEGLIDGMNVTGIVSLSQAKGPAVPVTAVVEDGGRNYIFVVDKEDDGKHERAAETRFRRVEIMRGNTEAGYCAITPVEVLPDDTQIATRGAFFINAKLVNTGEHSH